MAEQNLNDRPVGELVQQLSQHTATLVRQELQLAQLEMKEKGKRFGMAGGLFGGAGLVAAYGVGALIAMLILLLATFLKPWIAALIVTILLFAIAAVLGLTGKKQVDEAGPPKPEQAIASTQKDIEEVKGRAGS